MPVDDAFVQLQDDYLEKLNLLWRRYSGLGNTDNDAVVDDGTTITLDLTLGYRVYDIVLTGSRTLQVIVGAPMQDGWQYMLRVTQPAGAATLTAGTNVKFGTDVTAFLLSAGGSKTDKIAGDYRAASGKLEIDGFARGY